MSENLTAATNKSDSKMEQLRAIRNQWINEIGIKNLNKINKEILKLAHSNIGYEINSSYHPK